MLLKLEPLHNENGLRLVNEIDISNADELERAILPLVEAGGDIVVDSSPLTFMDSMGYHVLIGAAHRLQDRGAWC